ncbi:MAG: sulfatase [Spirochaetes bacterium]|nr:sulfatase [Spirochaetota bacterium]
MDSQNPVPDFSRRQFLSTAALGALSLPLLGQRPPGRRPNILFIPVDDLKPLLGCYGNPEILTPNLDALAARGAVFLNNHCQQAVCGPTRASLMTGLYPDSTGVWDLQTRMRDVHPDVLSLPQYLRQNGYETTGIGKTYDYRCVDKLLDEPSWSIPYVAYAKPMGESFGPYHRPLTQKGRGSKAQTSVGPATECLDLPDDRYGDHAVTEEGMKLLERVGKGEKPFFLAVGYARPHLPFVAPKKYWDLYDRSKIPLAEFRDKPRGMPALAYQDSGELRSGYTDIPEVGPLDEAMQRELIHGYMACVSFVDAQIGRLLGKLEELGLRENTVVVLWGDHGWHLGDHGMWCKHTNFEHATRAPLLMAGPGIPKGYTSQSATGFIDIFPTLCSLTGLAAPSALQGRSLAPLLSGRQGDVHGAILSQYPRSLDGNPVMGYALRDRRFRLVRWMQMNYRKGERRGVLVAREFYDYEKDPLEKVNAIDNPAYAGEIARLEGLFAEQGVAQIDPEKAAALRTAAALAALTGFSPPAYNGVKDGLEAVPFEETGKPFQYGVKVGVPVASPENPSKMAFKLPVAVALKAGSTLEAKFWVSAERGEGWLKAIFQSMRPSIKALASVDVPVGTSWQEVVLTVAVKEDLAIGDAVLTCHLGKIKQVLRFGGWRLQVK